MSCTDRHIDYFNLHDLNDVDINNYSVFYYPMRVSQCINERRNYITPEIRDRIKSKEMILLCDCSYEVNKKYIKDWWWSVGDYHNFTADEVLFLTGGNATDSMPDYNTLEVNLFEMQSLHEIKRQLNEYTTGLEKKKFVCLNRLTKPHRAYTMLKIIENNLLSECHWSFFNHGNSITVNEIIELLKHPLFLQKSNFDVDTVKDLSEYVPYSADNNANAEKGIVPEQLLCDMYRNSDFMVVTETIYESSEGTFLTEKTFKPIANCVPFVICGQPGSIQKLRDRGYDTFDYLIDHSYDLASDNCRASMVADEILRLCNIDFSKYKDKIAKSTAHNYRLLTNEERYTHDIKSIHDKILDFCRVNLK